MKNTIHYDLPPETRSLEENIPPIAQLANGGLHGTNDFPKLGFGGPCPPSGTHRYYFKLYALDTKLAMGSGATKQEVENAMQGHILANAQLMGKYARNKP